MPIIVVGLGPGDPDLLTHAAYQALERAPEVVLRTRRHPTVALLEAWGIGCEGKEEAVWTALKPEGAWNDDFAHITWRLHPALAVSDLAKRAADAKLTPAQRKLALDTLAFIPEASAAQGVLELAKDKESPIHADAMWWLIRPMARPPTMLMPVMIKLATASPRTNFAAPSIAP